MCITPQRRIIRSAFTLVEVMIVIGIIVVLVALTTAAVMNFRTTGPTMATTTNLSKIKGALDTQWRAVLGKAQTELLPANFLSYAQWSQSQWSITPTSTSLADPRVKTEFVRLRLAQAFPTTFKEAFDPTGGHSSPPSFAKPWPAYVAYLNKLGITGATTDSAEVQSAVCLMMALEVGPQNGKVTPEVLGGSAAVKLTLVNNNQAYGCVDGWGRGLMFSRYTRDNPTSTAGALKLHPVILSMGPDAKAGVDNTLTLLSTSDSEYAYDNLTSREEWDTILRP